MNSRSMIRKSSDTRGRGVMSRVRRRDCRASANPNNHYVRPSDKDVDDREW